MIRFVLGSGLALVLLVVGWIALERVFETASAEAPAREVHSVALDPAPAEAAPIPRASASKPADESPAPRVRVYTPSPGNGPKGEPVRTSLAARGGQRARADAGARRKANPAPTPKPKLEVAAPKAARPKPPPAARKVPSGDALSVDERGTLIRRMLALYASLGRE